MKPYTETIQKVADSKQNDPFHASDAVIAIIADIYNKEYDEVDNDVADLMFASPGEHADHAHWEAEQASGLASLGG